MEDYISVSNDPAPNANSEHILSLSPDCVLAHVHSPIRHRRLLYDRELAPGMIGIFVNSGSFELTIQDKVYVASPHSLVTLPSSAQFPIGNIIDEPIDAYVLYMSVQMLNDINLDLSVLRPSFEGSNHSPIINGLTNDEYTILRNYARMLYDNTRMNGETIYAKNISRSLAQALIYQIMQLRLNHAGNNIVTDDKGTPLRMNYVVEFMSLVQKHHREHRSLAFYADKLFISPKYLSRIIKDATKHSAAEWIDRVVLIDAKNMLRFSNRNIQQVAYALNFPSQSAFGKFFKHLTGMSPSEYQQS